MGAESVKVPSPICEACYVKKHAQWEPQSMDEKGNILMRLVGIPIPEHHIAGNVETCKKCGSITISGIYDLEESDTVFPEDEGLF